MNSGLRVGVASQTPLVRAKRSRAEVEAERGPLPQPVPLAALARGVDYSLSPGGVSRMIGALVAARPNLRGEWTTLPNGLPELRYGNFRLSYARLPQASRDGYGRFKEIVWEALNGRPPLVADPLASSGEVATWRRDFEAWSHANARQMRVAELEEPFDVYYVNDWQHLPAGAALAGRPRVMHFHAPFADWTPSGWKRFVLQHLARFDATIVSTHEYADALERAGLRRPVHVVTPWLDPREHAKATDAEVAAFGEKYGIDEDDEVVVNVGRMDPIKGQDRLLAAFARVARRRPNAKLVLVGNGSFSSSKRSGIGLSKGQQWRARLEEMAGTLRLSNRVVFTGHLPHRDALAALRRGNAFAFPSVAEGFGLAVVEAWLQGTAAVVSKNAGVSTLIDGGNGVVADAADSAEFSEALIALLGDAERADRMGEAGRRTALGHCDVRKRAPEVEEILAAHAERREPDAPLVLGEPTGAGHVGT